MINQAMFQRNGRCGYVLKPLALRAEGEELLSIHTHHFFDVTVSCYYNYTLLLRSAISDTEFTLDHFGATASAPSR